MPRKRDILKEFELPSDDEANQISESSAHDDDEFLEKDIESESYSGSTESNGSSSSSSDLLRAAHRFKKKHYRERRPRRRRRYKALKYKSYESPSSSTESFNSKNKRKCCPTCGQDIQSEARESLPAIQIPPRMMELRNRDKILALPAPQQAQVASDSSSDTSPYNEIPSAATPSAFRHDFHQFDPFNIPSETESDESGNFEMNEASQRSTTSETEPVNDAQVTTTSSSASLAPVMTTTSRTIQTARKSTGAKPTRTMQTARKSTGGKGGKPTRTIQTARKSTGAKPTRTIQTARKSTGAKPTRTMQIARKSTGGKPTRTMQTARKSTGGKPARKTMQTARKSTGGKTTKPKPAVAKKTAVKSDFTVQTRGIKVNDKKKNENVDLVRGDNVGVQTRNRGKARKCAGLFLTRISPLPPKK